MFLTDLQTWLSIAILAGSACLQASVGFAAGLLGIPLLLWAGNSLPQAQVMIITAMLPQNALALWRLRQHTSLGEVAGPAAIRLAFLPLGILFLAYVVHHSSALIKPIVGGIVLAAVIAQSIHARPWENAGRWQWVWVAFGLSGLLQGFSGMSAPPMLLWIHGQRFAAKRARSFLFAIYLSSFLPQMIIMLLTFGPGIIDGMKISLVALPLVVAGAIVGLKVGNRLGDRWLRPVTYGLLVWMAVLCLLDPWLS